jgi:S1-C subfamily serine protease
MPSEVAGERIAGEFGFFIREVFIEKEIGNWLGPTGSLAVVAEVLSGTRADRGGLQVNDVLQRINDHPLRSFREAAQVLARAPLDQPLRLVVRRGGEDHVTLTLGGLAPADDR